MKAIILAAGIGSRLYPMTHSKPKTLVEVNGKPMLGYLIDNLIGAGISDITICVGFEANQIKKFCTKNYSRSLFHFVDNTDYLKTNNMYTLYLARDFLDDDVIIMNADLVYGQAIIEKILQTLGSVVACDKGSYNEESMKVTVEDGVITSISKAITPENSYGNSIDVYKIVKADLPILIEKMTEIVEKDKKQWTEVLLDQLFFSGKLKASPMDIDGQRWFEIDNFEDLAKAEVLFNDKLSALKDKKIFFVDRDGTLTLGSKVLPGANELIERIRAANKFFYVLTNNSSRTPDQHFESIKDMGLNLHASDVLVSTNAAIEYFKQHGLTKAYIVANDAVKDWIDSRGITHVEENPQAVLLTYDDSISYAKIVSAIKFIRDKIPYFATHPDIVCPTIDGFVPDIGAFIEMIRMATMMQPQNIFGKPSLGMIESTLVKEKLKLSDAVIIGDRLYTDIAMADDNDLTSILVLTGETKREDYEKSKERADIVVPSLETLLSYLS